MHPGTKQKQKPLSWLLSNLKGLRALFFNHNIHKMEYRVFKSEYYNKLGESTNTSFFIKKKKTILRFSYWKTITHKESGMGDYYNVETTFKTKKDAEKFIKNVL